MKVERVLIGILCITNVLTLVLALSTLAIAKRADKAASDNTKAWARHVVVDH